MKNSIKITISVIICSITMNTFSQNLVSKVSDKASLVLQINGGNTFKDVSVLEVENSLMFKEIMSETFQWSEMTKPENFADMGVNISSKLFFVIENYKDIDYFYFAYSIQDYSKFSNFVKSGISNQNGITYNSSNGLHQIIYSNTSRLVWNNNYAIHLMSKYTGNAFQKEYYYNWSDYSNEEVEEVEIEVHELDEEIQEMIESPNETYENDYQNKQRLKEEAFYKEEALKEVKKGLFIDSSLTARTKLFFTINSINSFIPKGFNQTAVVSLWYNGMDIANFPNPYNLSMYNKYNSQDIFGLQSLYKAEYTSNIYLEDDKISVKSSVDFSDKLKQSADKIYNSKLDRKFGRYLPNNTLAYSTFSFNTADLLKESTHISKDYFATTSSFEYNQEVSLYLDLLEIMLDEDAIAKLVTGDAVVLLNNISSKEVSYKTWAYDENFNQTEVTETKNEMIPEFTIMLGSQNEDILNKLFKLSMKHHILSPKESYFVSNEQFKNDLPFDMYLCFKDGILFMTNSNTQIKNILNGKVESKMNRKQRKHIMKNSGTVFIDMEKITSKILDNESFSKELGELASFKDDIKQLVLTSTYKSGNFNSDIYITIPEDEDNSSIYLLNIINEIVKAQK